MADLSFSVDYIAHKAGDTTQPMDFVLSDNSVNRYGSRVITIGINLEAFKKNPVMLWGHRRYSEGQKTNIIGKWENIRVENNQLIATAVFDEGSELGKEVKRQVEGGFVNAVSIGFYAKKWSNDPVYILPEQTDWTITEADLLEVSFVDVPANPNATQLNFISNHIKQQENMKKVADVLGLTAEATEQQIVNSVSQLQAANQNLTSENQQLKAKIAASEEAEKKRRCDELVATAIKEGRIIEGSKNAYINYAMIDFEACKADLEKMPAYKSLSTQIEQLGNGGGQIDEVKKFQAMSKEEKSKLLNSNPEEYQRLNALLVAQGRKDGLVK